VQRAQAPVGADAADQLGGSEDARDHGHVLEVGFRHLALRRAADAAAVEEQRVVPVGVPVVARSLTAERERARALHEERPLLLEEVLIVE
jgi:hypothetical protein